MTQPKGRALFRCRRAQITGGILFQFILAIHILAAVIFLGNLITTAFWKVRADRSGNLENMAMTSRSVLLADYVFTGPGIATLLVTGILLAGLSGW